MLIRLLSVHRVEHLPAWRRVATALASLVVAAFVFRVQIAGALVTRGDEFLTRGSVSEARKYYARALAIDWDSPSAADRFVFYSAAADDRRILLRAIDEATSYLSAHPGDAQLFMDRALCFSRLKDYALAARDFAAAARVTGSARDFTFAGWAAHRSGRPKDARRFWHDALERDPAFGPARVALSKTGL